MRITRTSTTRLSLFFAFTLLCRGAAGGIADLKGTAPNSLPNGGEFESSVSCAGCHASVLDQPRDYMPSDTWTGTMMANAWRDPVFTAALTIANQDVPGVGTFCLRCHTPIGFQRGRATPPDGSALDADAQPGVVIDGQGVGCDVCHRVTTLPESDENFPYYIGNAQLVFGYEIAPPDPDNPGSSGLIKYGPYENVYSINHAGKQDPNISTSRFCGQCHQVTNPERMLRDASGIETALEFPLDTTYEEWASSDFRDDGPDPKSCISCHMRPKVGEWALSKHDEPKRTDPRDHAIVGGNHWGIQAVMAAHEEYAQEYARHFQLALDRTLESLASAASVTLVEAPKEAAPGQDLQVTVRVENLTGHKFPTGYAESRRAWIAVFLVDEQGNERALLGGYDADTGEIQHEPKTHEYRAVHGRWNEAEGRGEKEEHLALHDMIISDTRIPPKGFVPSPTTMPTAEIDFSDGNGGYRHYDEATFTLTVPADVSGTQTLSARVYYQSMTREYIEFLRAENHTDDRGEKLFEIYEATGEAPPILVASDEARLDIGSGPDNTGGNGGAANGNGGAANGNGGAADGGGGDGGAVVTPRQGDSGGCGCRTPADAPVVSLPGTLAAIALASAVARRRWTRRRR